jgi:hypothetical protein
MKFTSGGLYRNRYQIDVDMLVTKTAWETDQCSKLSIHWIHRKSRYLIVNDKVEVKAEHYKDWKRIWE